MYYIKLAPPKCWCYHHNLYMHNNHNYLFMLCSIVFLLPSHNHFDYLVILILEAFPQIFTSSHHMERKPKTPQDPVPNYHPHKLQ